MEQVKVGDTIRIIRINDIANDRYSGKTGVVQVICQDPWGDTRIEGTWGTLALYPNEGDRFEVIQKGDER